tara:strand:+ start:495 stop:767 length:273 start_codon:yes stop_codon:yes gene_type:complete
MPTGCSVPTVAWPAAAHLQHPANAQAKAVEVRQRQQGEADLHKRLSVLREYEEKLLVAHAAKLQEYQATAVAVWAEDAARRKHADTKWVR